MAYTVQMPALGESVTEGTVTRWLKQEGDHVDVDEPLLEVSTDKVDTEIPSPQAGVLQRIVAQEDDTVEVGGDPAQRVGKDRILDQFAATALDADAVALVPVDQMWRGVDVDALAGGLEQCPAKGGDRSLAVGAGDMDHRRQFFVRIAQNFQQPGDAVERQIKTLGVEPQEFVNHSFRFAFGGLIHRAHSAPPLFGVFSRLRRRRPSVG